MAYPNQTLDDKTLKRPNAFNVYFTDVTPWGIIMDGGLDVLATFTRASVGTTEIQQNVFTTAAINETRHKWVGGRRGLLIEPAATNLLFPSAVAATMNATVSATAYTLSFFGAGTVTLSGASTGAVVGTGSALKTFTFTPTAGALTLTVSGAVTEWQLETGVVATSRIITTSAAVTRAADVPTMATSVFGFNASEGTFVCDWLSSSVSGSGFAASALFNLPGTASNRISFFGGAGGSVLFEGFQGGVNQFDINAGPSFAGTPQKAACSYGLNYFAASANGGVTAVDTSGLVTSPISNMLIGMVQGQGQLNGVIFNLTYYPRKFTPAELQAAST